MNPQLPTAKSIAVWIIAACLTTAAVASDAYVAAIGVGTNSARYLKVARPADTGGTPTLSQGATGCRRRFHFGAGRGVLAQRQPGSIGGGAGQLRGLGAG